MTMSLRPVSILLTVVAFAVGLPLATASDEIPPLDGLFVGEPSDENLTPTAGGAVDATSVTLNELAVDASSQPGDGSSGGANPPGPDPASDPGEMLFGTENGLPAMDVPAEPAYEADLAVPEQPEPAETLPKPAVEP
ncbi:MAG TPA: hypothetical protein VI796_06005, partial [Candidatus Thermoplasmatota archaeon]|nr:hypothetical protein [Candidatus Thermoplasmatota archaeon]